MYRKAMDTCVIEYLRDSCQNGLKHANTILPSGCSAGEAGVDFFRKRGKVCTTAGTTPTDLSDVILQAVSNHLNVRCSKDTVHKHIHSTQNVLRCSRKLARQLKALFRELGVNRRLYCAKMPLILKEIKSLAESAS
jgi:hypothetical protein